MLKAEYEMAAHEAKVAADGAECVEYWNDGGECDGKVENHTFRNGEVKALCSTHWDMHKVRGSWTIFDPSADEEEAVAEAERRYEEREAYALDRWDADNGR